MNKEKMRDSVINGKMYTKNFNVIGLVSAK